VVDKADHRVEWYNTTSGTFEGQFNGSGEYEVKGVKHPTTVAGFGLQPGEKETGPLELPESIAVDNACALHNPELTEATTPKCSEFDPSAGDVYVVDNRSGEGPLGESFKVVDKFSATGEYLGQITEAPEVGEFADLGFGHLYGVAVGVTGEVWVDEQNEGSTPAGAAVYGHGAVNPFLEFLEFPPVKSGEGHQEPKPEAGPGFAVDATRDTFVKVQAPQQGVHEFPGSGGEGRQVEEQPASGVAVEMATGDAYIDLEGSVSRLSSKLGSLETPGAGILKSGSGVAVSSKAEAVYVADSAANLVDVFASEPVGKPTAVSDEPAAEVTAGSAKTSGQVNARGGANASWRFEYGPCASAATCSSSVYSDSTPSVALPADFETYPVSVRLEGLQANTTYHFRLVAANREGEGAGEEQVFTTQVGGSRFTLLDGRGWEMVTPPNLYGAELSPIIQQGVIQAAKDGNAFTTFALAPTEPGAQSNNAGVQVLASRGSAGWSSRDISPPVYGPAAGPPPGKGLAYRFFSEDLSEALYEPFGVFPPKGSPFSLSPEASEQTPFLRQDFLNGNATELCTAGCYRPILSAADVLEGAHFEPKGGGCPPLCAPPVAGATPNLGHVVVSSPVALTSTPLPVGADGLYEWAAESPVAASLALVNLLPREGGVEAVAPSARLGSEGRAAASISQDGTRVVWQTTAPEKHLYVRDMVHGETVQLDAPGAGAGPGPAPSFQFAASEGPPRVLLTDSQRLAAGSGENDLYECLIVEGADGLECQRSDLTPLGKGGVEAKVQGVVGASADGLWVYFVANGVLAPGAVPGECRPEGEQPPAGARCNLYVLHGGVTRLVAVLSANDLPDWRSILAGNPSRVSADGEWLEFMSQARLTGYDNQDAVSGQPDEEVYLYHATGNGGSGTLTCASCNPSGVRPAGTGNLPASLAGHTGGWPETTWVAGNVPGWTSVALDEGSYQSHALFNSGRLFFDSSDVLVSKDVNAAEDVYEYEPEGVGSEVSRCGPSSASGSVAFKSEHPFTNEQHEAGREPAGCVGLISAGTGPEAAFLDASESGNDVFFLTAARLSPQDKGTQLEVYDAHVCTEESPCISPVEAPQICVTADACRAAPTPQPSFPGGESGTASVFGEDNLAPTLPAPTVKPKPKAVKCPKNKTRNKHGKCMKRKKAKKAKAGNKRKGKS